MSALRAQLLVTTNLFLGEFNRCTPQSVIAFRTPSCRHWLLPASLGAPVRSNAEYSAFVESLLPVMRGFKLHLAANTDPIVDEEARKVVLHLTSTAETNIGPYANEYVWVLKFTDDGKEISEIMEFADSAYTLEKLGKLAEAAKAQ